MDLGGGTPKFFDFYVPRRFMFYCIVLINEYLKKLFLKFGVLCPVIIGEKFIKISKIFLKIFQLFQNRKNLSFLHSNKSKITIFIKNIAEFSHKTPPDYLSFLNFFSFQNYRRKRRRKFRVLSHKKTYFSELAPSLSQGPP